MVSKNYKFLNIEFFKRLISVIIFVPICIFPLLYSHYLSVFVYLIFNSVILSELFSMKHNKNKFFIGISMLIASFSFISFLLLLVSKDEMYIKLLEIIFIIWLFDTFSFLGGKLLGGKKLIPKISSGKTYSGLIVGFLFSLIFIESFKYFIVNLSGHSIYFTVIIIIIAFFGDMIASMLKRHASVKDSGNIMPGHGGLFDRFDSFIGVFFLYGTYHLIQ